jgi:hypothetical protein
MDPIHNRSSPASSRQGPRPGRSWPVGPAGPLRLPGRAQTRQGTTGLLSLSFIRRATSLARPGLPGPPVRSLPCLSSSPGNFSRLSWLRGMGPGGPVGRVCMQKRHRPSTAPTPATNDLANGPPCWHPGSSAGCHHQARQPRFATNPADLSAAPVALGCVPGQPLSACRCVADMRNAGSSQGVLNATQVRDNPPWAEKPRAVGGVVTGQGIFIDPPEGTAPTIAVHSRGQLSKSIQNCRPLPCNRPK